MSVHERIARIPLVSISFLIIVPLSAHLLFSSLGFNPTDDGFTLAISRRIIDGQIPHRDFIIIRPILSPLLHAPFVLWGGDYTYLFSRFFVWFELACISWLWISIIESKLVGQPFKNIEKVSIALISFAVSAHNFPIVAWHTIDGILLLSIGLKLSLTEKQTNKLVGYLLIGLAYLCKQSFLLAAPLTLIILSDWRKPKYWLAVLAPGILYVLFLLVACALPDAVLQLTSQRDILSAGLRSYFNRETLLGILIGYFSTRLIFGSVQLDLPLSKEWREWLGLLMLSVIPLIGVSMKFLSGGDILILSFRYFGLLAGVVGCLLVEPLKKSDKRLEVPLLALMIAWSASLSIGYNYPVLMSGPLLALLLAYTYPVFLKRLEGHIGKRILKTALVAFSAITLLSFAFIRMHNIYRDRAVSGLTKRLDAVLPGGMGIKTNENTYNFLVDLREAIRVSQSLGETYTIIPDCAGWWVKSTQVNPLSIDWLQGTELNRPELVGRVIRELESLRNKNTVIVQKVEANNLANGFAPLSEKYQAVEYVRHHFTKVQETSMFELYK